MSNHVEVCSPEEAARYIRLLGGEKALTKREELLKGYVDIVCREADGSVAWEVHQPNLITDFGRRWWAGAVGVTGMYVVSSPSVEPADINRASHADDGSASSSQYSALVTPTYDSATLTKTWTAPAFTAPASNRQVGFVGITTSLKVASMVYRLFAYTRLTPVRTQTTTQTLEVVYKITLTPLY